MIERDVAVLVLLIDQDRMALREGAALAVLAGQAHREALEQQRAVGQRLGRRPGDALALLDGLGAVVEEALDRAVDMEILGHRSDFAADVLERIDGDAGMATARIVGIARDLESGP